MSEVAAGYYQDPEDPGFERYWNGAAWTGVRRPHPTSGTRSRKRSWFGGRANRDRQAQPGADVEHADLEQARAEIGRLRQQLGEVGGLELGELRRLRDQLAAEVTDQQQRLDALQAEIITTQDEQILQEIGIYDYRHPLTDAVAYREALTVLQGEIKAMARRDGGAIEASLSWHVNGSLTEGRKAIREYSKLMLRAYNAEADNLVRGMKPYKLQSSLDRLDKVAFTIERLGKTMSLRVAAEYHQLRFRELELTADYLEKLAQQKANEREERERLREERKAQAELAREREKLDKEYQHYINVLAALEAAGKGAEADELRDRLDEIKEAIERVDFRAANIRAGYVYVISNLGAFGDKIVKIGLTRRLEPMDRIRELSNASVPFKFDVHALFFATDAVGIEAEMHRRLADRRVNRVNTRREFFYATPAEAREHLKELTGQLLQFDELAEAVEFRQSAAVARAEVLAPGEPRAESLVWGQVPQSQDRRPGPATARLWEAW